MSINLKSLFSKNKHEVHHGKRWLLNESSPFIMTEAFRNLLSNLTFAVPKKENDIGKIIGISSATVSEGKSTIVSNLAITCANAGYKTVIIDCDMRKPKIRSIFNLPKSKGLVDFLSGQIKYEEFLIKDYIPNLDILPTYKTAPNPTALLVTPVFEELLERLSHEYEYVLIDTPPINVVSDCINIAPKTDGIALVVRPELSDHKSIQNAIYNIEFTESNFLGFIMNSINQKENRGRYYKKYYKYGYSSSGQKTSEESKIDEKEEKNKVKE
ncbi:MAG: CpsD/CapB family tyrosine-protein kinase [Clostridia bacterium]|nr:CpsD/CapB family tyrosine-protein kinase [Clostridia bacterium]